MRIFYGGDYHKGILPKDVFTMVKFTLDLTTSIKHLVRLNTLITPHLSQWACFH